VPAAAVPETAVNEDGQPCLAEYEVGVAEQRLVPAPAGDAGGAEDRCEL